MVGKGSNLGGDTNKVLSSIDLGKLIECDRSPLPILN